MTQRTYPTKLRRGLSKRAAGQSLRFLSFRRNKDRKEFDGIGEHAEQAHGRAQNDLRTFAQAAEEQFLAINASMREPAIKEDETTEGESIGTNNNQGSTGTTAPRERKPTTKQPSLKIFLEKNPKSKKSAAGKSSVCSAPTPRRNPAIGARSLRTMVNEYESIVGDC